MHRIPMYDFPREYELNRKRYCDVFDTVCRTGHFAGGEFSAAFERDFAAFLDVPFCAAVNSGTSALFLALTASGVGRGDEVIVPSATFTATPAAVMMCGAKPVFADCDEKTWQISPDEVKKLITEKTKAVIGVHLYGGMFDVEEIKKITDDAGIVLIEDTAQAFGSKYKDRYAGTFGDAGCFSFYPTKNLGAFGEGGAVVSEDEELIRRVNALKTHDAANGFAVLGYNMRMDGIQGAILSSKLADMPDFLDKKRAIAKIYDDAVSDNPLLSSQYMPPQVTPSYHLFAVKTDDRERFRAYMDERGIETGVQYAVPCHKQKVFTDAFGYSPLPVTEDLLSKCVSVPSYPYLTDGDIRFVAEALKNYR